MDNKEKRLIFIFNATPLIHFGKSGLAWMIEKLNGEKYIPPTVYKEVVVTSKNKGFEDAPIIENLIHRKVITTKKPKKTSSHSSQRVKRTFTKEKQKS